MRTWEGKKSSRKFVVIRCVFRVEMRRDDAVLRPRTGPVGTTRRVLHNIRSDDCVAYQLVYPEMKAAVCQVAEMRPSSEKAESIRRSLSGQAPWGPGCHLPSHSINAYNLLFRRSHSCIRPLSSVTVYGDSDDVVLSQVFSKPPQACRTQ
jgi:hypothetical protein